jgi:phage terminase large subunit-like protein
MAQARARNPMTISFPETSMSSDASLRDALISYDKEGLLTELLASFNWRCLEFMTNEWPTWAHDHQKFPLAGNNGQTWTTWLILGGRGAGKTRAGAEWVRELASNDPQARIALIGETEHDAREVMVEGVSGLFAVHRYDARPQWIPSRRRLEWKNGAVAQVFSAEDPENLRGPQFSAAWADELAKWRQARRRRSPATWRNGR